MTTRNPYPTDLSDEEWDVIQPSVPQANARRRPEKYPKRDILNGIFYVARSGCAWRLLPHDLPPWESVYHSFWHGRQDGTWQLMHDLLRGDVREAEGRHRQPSAGSLESQSVKTTAKGGSAAMTRPSRSRGARAIVSSLR
jgi:putative transposase